MVVGMKTIAIEFTLTSTALRQDGHDSLRCRVLLTDQGKAIACWRATNVLGEDVWLGGDSCDCGPMIGAVHVTREGIIWWAMREMTRRLAAGRELPNGAIVFDLGTV
jgi:hypothetical protein